MRKLLLCVNNYFWSIAQLPIYCLFPRYSFFQLIVKLIKYGVKYILAKNYIFVKKKINPYKFANNWCNFPDFPLIILSMYVDYFPVKKPTLIFLASKGIVKNNILMSLSHLSRLLISFKCRRKVFIMIILWINRLLLSL